MHLPNYRDGSIVNLMSSITRAFGAKSPYGVLKTLDMNRLRKSDKILLLVIDGLGYEYLQKNGAHSVLKEHLHAKITSVFPSTTATGITTFLTGLAPQQHAITGWFMLIKELGLVARILPFNPRYGGPSIGKTGIDSRTVFNLHPISTQIKAESHYLMPDYLVDSDYSAATSQGATTHGCKSVDECLKMTKDVITSKSGRKFIYAYLPDFDSLCHEFGTQSREVLLYFQQLNHALVELLDALRESDTAILITSDHGLIDTETMDRISLEEHPDLTSTLSLPLCGEPRVAYCYVHPARVKRFRDYVATHLGDYCTLYKSSDLVRKHFFGLHEANPHLFDRIGDYALIMKENYVLKDFVLGESTHFLRANHGGVSKEEMYVPLITIFC
jgi:hypothetical protein